MITTASEIKNNFGHYLKHVIEEDGEVIITKNNVRVARLVPYETGKNHDFIVREKAVDYDDHCDTVSYEEFMEIYEKSDNRMELINGQIFLMASPGFFHQAILGNLYLFLKAFFKGRKCKPIIAPFDIHFRKKDCKDPDVMQPDVAVLCDLENSIDEKGKYTGTPALVVEILSPNTRSKDLVYKLNTYMTSGVEEYWIIDPEHKTVALYNFTDYEVATMEFYKKGETVVSHSFEGLSIKVDLLFDEEL